MAFLAVRAAGCVGGRVCSLVPFRDVALAAVNEEEVWYELAANLGLTKEGRGVSDLWSSD